MRKQILNLILATTSVLSATLAGAQATKPTAPPAATQPAGAPTATVSVSGQWEYLVISFGKTYFSSAVDIAAKQSGQSKLMIFGPLGGVVASEALDVQSQVDTLGRYGWELIGVLGAIGGDQEWIFKRPFDPNRAAKEATQIKKDGDALAAARDKAAKEATAKPTTPPPTELVDLDTQESRAKQAAADAALRADVTSKLQLPGWSTAELVASDLSVYTSSYDGKTRTLGTATLQLDVTQRALNGNTYRRSSVQTIIDEYLTALKAQGRNVVKSDYSSCLDGGTAFKIGASVKFNNEWQEVVYPSTTYCLK